MTTEPENRFESWLSGPGQELWRILHHPVSGHEDHSEDFLKVLGLSRRRIERSFRQKGDAANATKIFLRNWVRRQESPVAWESRLLILGLFYLRWSGRDVASMLGVSQPALKFRAVSELKRLHFGESEGPRPISRDCVRFDLFFIDLALNTEWSDPLHLVSKSALLQHKKKCARCQEVDQGLNKEIEKLRTAEISHAWADRDRELLLRESTGTRRILSFEWFDVMPWYVKTPLQMMLVTAAIMVALAVPYVGDLFPNLNLRERIAQYWPLRETPHEVAKVHPTIVLPTPPPAAVEPAPAPPAPIATVAKAPTPPPAAEPVKPVAPATQPAPVTIGPVAAAPLVEPVYLENPLPPMINPNHSNWKTAGLPRPVFVPPPMPVEPTPAPAPVATVAKATPPPEPPKPLPPPPKPAPVAAAAAPAPAPAPAKPVVVAKNEAVDKSVDKAASSSKVSAQMSGDEALEDPATEGVGEKVFFRWGAFSKDIEGDNAKITAILNKYHAEAAGEIPLGGDYLGGRYFHFTIARDDFAAILREVKELDLIGLTNAKATSSRVTPAQRRRVVFLVRPQ